MIFESMETKKNLQKKTKGRGRPPLTQNQKDVLAHTKTQAKIHISSIYNAGLSEIKEKLSDPSTSIGERVFIRFFLDLQKKADHRSMDLLLRILGINTNPSVNVETVNVNSDNKKINVQFVGYPDDETSEDAGSGPGSLPPDSKTLN